MEPEASAVVNPKPRNRRIALLTASLLTLLVLGISSVMWYRAQPTEADRACAAIVAAAMTNSWRRGQEKLDARAKTVGDVPHSSEVDPAAALPTIDVYIRLLGREKGLAWAKDGARSSLRMGATERFVRENPEHAEAWKRYRPTRINQVVELAGRTLVEQAFSGAQ